MLLVRPHGRIRREADTCTSKWQEGVGHFMIIYSHENHPFPGELH
jgi:hypothetical protein